MNKVGLLNHSSSQNSVPQAINILYKGSSIQEKEELFDEFLSNGIVIIKNFAFDLKIMFTFSLKMKMHFLMEMNWL